MQRGLSQEQLGFDSKLHRNAVSLIERGERSTSLETIEKLAKGLRVNVRDLFPL